MSSSHGPASLRLAMASADRLVEEYLLFRGFTETREVMIAEIRSDKACEFQVDKIVEALLKHLTTYNFKGMMDLWHHLEERFLAKLHHSYSGVVAHLELSLKRFFLVNAVQCGKLDKVVEFFEVHAHSLRGEDEWADWFALPFLRDPAAEPAFKAFFTKEWASRLVVSIHNLLTTVFHEVPLPALMSQHLHAIKVQKLQSTVAELQGQVQTLAARLGDTALTGRASDSRSDSGPGAGHQGSERGRATLPEGTSPSTDGGGVQGRREEAVASGGASRTRSGGSQHESAELKILGSRALSGHSKTVNRCVFSSDGGTVASASDDGTVRLWAAGRGADEEAQTFRREATIMCGAQATSLAWDARSERILLLGTDGGNIRAWDADAKKMVFDASSPLPVVRSMAAAQDGASFVVAAHDQAALESCLNVYAMRDGRSTSRFTVPDGSCITCLHLNHNGSLLASGCSVDGTVRIFDVRSGSAIMQWHGHEGGVRSVQLGRDDTSLFTAGTDGMVHEWSAHMEGKLLASICMQEERQTTTPRCSSALSPDTSFAVFCTGDEAHAVLAHLPPKEGKMLRIRGHEGDVCAVDWSPQASSPAVVSSDTQGHLRVTYLSHEAAS